jgi:hypothetical protein
MKFVAGGCDRKLRPTEQTLMCLEPLRSAGKLGGPTAHGSAASAKARLS